MTETFNVNVMLPTLTTQHQKDSRISYGLHTEVVLATTQLYGTKLKLQISIWFIMDSLWDFSSLCFHCGSTMVKCCTMEGY